MKYEINQHIEVNELHRLYQSVTWTGYTDYPDKLRSILPSSLWWCACIENGELVGLIRLVGDGVSIIYVQDILVNPEYQRQGIGTTLFKYAFDHFKDVRQFVLITDDQPETRAFYNNMGLSELKDTGAVGFIRYNFNV